MSQKIPTQKNSVKRKAYPQKFQPAEILDKIDYKIEIRPYMVKLKRAGLPQPCKPKGKRGAVRELSVASGLRLQETITSVDPAHGLPLFVTLTYPKDWPGSPEVWKRHLDNFRRELDRQTLIEVIGVIWRLEAQRRGAPHYHLLIWHKENLPTLHIKPIRRWLAKVWFRIVGSRDLKHFRAGTQCDKVEQRRLRQAMIYLTKYLGKDSVHPKSQVFDHPVGRYWGVWNKEKLLFPVNESELPKKDYMRLRRDLRNLRSKYRKAKNQRDGPTDTGQRANDDRLAPGVRAFVEEKDMWKLWSMYDPPPF